MKKIYFVIVLLAIFSVTTQAQTYCAASGGMDEYISNVSVGSISNVSMSTPYTDFTALSTDMVIGESYTATVTNGNPYSYDQCGIWIDWNQDFDFTDPGEYYPTLGTPGNGPYSVSIVPPDSAVLGQTRMRVRVMYTGTLLPCGISQYGEVEDYTINVLSNCQADAGFNFFDLGLTVDFVAPQNYDTTLFSLNWVLGDGTTIANQSQFTHLYALPGNYQVSLSVSDLNDTSCYDHFTDTLYIDSCAANAEFNFEVDELYVELYSYFHYDTLLYEVTWDMGDSTVIQGGDSVSYTYVAPGIYPVSLTVINLSDTSCQNTVGYDLEAYVCTVLADFDVDILGFEAFFSTPASAGDYIIEWDFGDGSYSYNLSNTYHQYPSLGTFTATLTLTDILQPLCFDEISYQVLINDCFADANFDFANFGLLSAYQATTYSSAGYSFFWDFGDGTIDSSGTFVLHTFADVGTYTVSLTVISDSIPLCSDVESFTITVDSCLAYADFWYDDNELSVDFSPDYPIDTVGYLISWDFGDGTTATQIIEPNHVYAASGIYQVSMSISNLYDPSCTDTFTIDIEIFSCDANAEFTITDNGNNNYDFVLLNNYSSGSGYSINWYFSDGTSSWNVDSVNHTFSQSGAFSATCIVNNWSIPNCADTFVYVICDIHAGFNYYLNGLEVTFSTIEPYNIMSSYAQWDFGDGATQQSTFNPTHTFATDDTYTITCIITSIGFPECTDTVTMDLYVAECYVFSDFDYQIDSTTVTFTTTFSSSDYFFYWTFGDGSTQVGVPNTIHTYATTGTYTACLTLVEIANSNCRDTMCQTLLVYPINIAENSRLVEEIKLFPNPVEEKLFVEFYSDKATNYEADIYSTTGQKVTTELLQSKAGLNTFSIDVGWLPSGIFYMVLKADEKASKILKFVK